mgnify:CR=1 FL=1
MEEIKEVMHKHMRLLSSVFQVRLEAGLEVGMAVGSVTGMPISNRRRGPKGSALAEAEACGGVG